MKTGQTALVIVLLTGLALGGCTNTFEGVGRDVERAGQTIQKNF